MDKVLFNFIIPHTPGHTLAELQDGELADFWHLYCQGEYSWVLQTYHALKPHGLLLKLSHELDSEAVNLAHGNILRVLPKRPDCYCVSLQADFPHYPLAQYHVVQNQMQVGMRTVYMAHWPQVGQAVRDASRDGVRQVAYQGAAQFTDLDVERIRVDLKAKDIGFDLLGESNWKELDDVDVLVGIRQFGKRDYKRKPPSKLINAWHAGIPFIGGWDSAYSQIGDPGKDYFRVSSHEEMIDRIVQLKQEPKTYADMVEAGRLRVVHYTFEATVHHWRWLLDNEISNDYRGWLNDPVKMLLFRIKVLKFQWRSITKMTLRTLYRIPSIKRWRELHYDPVK